MKIIHLTKRNSAFHSYYELCDSSLDQWEIKIHAKREMFQYFSLVKKRVKVLNAWVCCAVGMFLAFLILDIASAILVTGHLHYTVFFLCFVCLSYLLFKVLFVFIFIECAGCIVSSSISAHKLSSATEQVVYISWSLCKKLPKNI